MTNTTDPYDEESMQLSKRERIIKSLYDNQYHVTFQSKMKQDPKKDGIFMPAWCKLYQNQQGFAV